MRPCFVHHLIVALFALVCLGGAPALAQIVNNATVTGTPRVGTLAPDTASESVDLEDANPSMDVSKSADTASVSADGVTITYTITVENDGNFTLRNLVLADVLSQNGNNTSLTLSGPSGDADSDSELDVTETWTYTASYTTTQANIDDGNDLVNTITITSDETGGTTFSDTAITTITQNPAFTIAKVVDTANLTSPGLLTYTITVVNTGNVTLTSPVLTDNLLQGAASRTLTSGPTLLAGGDADTDGEVDVGETWVYEATYNVPQGNITNGQDLVNTATFDAAEVSSASDTATTTITQTPSLTLTKVADVASVDEAGDVINYTITLENTGNININSITVSDPLLASISCTPGTGPNPNNMGVGTTRTCTGSYTVLQSDLDNNGGGDGDIDNTATVNANWSGPLPAFTQDASASVSLVLNPSLTVTKVANLTSNVAAGTTVTYTYVVTNNGNQTISSITLSDLHAGTGTDPVPDPDTGTLSDASPFADSSNSTTGDNEWDALAPGDSITVTATYVVTQTDVDTLQ